VARLANRSSGQPLADGEQKGVVRLATRSARDAGTRAVASGRWLSEVTLEVAGHLPVRDRATLQAHHHGLGGSLLAGSLIKAASRTTAAVGAATGAIAAASETTPNTWGTLPLELAVETLVVVAIEMKLVGELQEAAGLALPHSLRYRGPLIARAWAETRGIGAGDLAAIARSAQPGAVGMAAADLLSRGARDQLTAQLKRQLLRRTGRNMAAFTPMLLGAAAGAALNRRATRMLGNKVATSLGIPPPAT
jgi:hypothetical protein